MVSDNRADDDTAAAADAKVVGTHLPAARPSGQTWKSCCCSSTPTSFHMSPGHVQAHRRRPYQYGQVEAPLLRVTPDRGIRSNGLRPADGANRAAPRRSDAEQLSALTKAPRQSFLLIGPHANRDHRNVAHNLIAFNRRRLLLRLNFNTRDWCD